MDTLYLVASVFCLSHSRRSNTSRYTWLSFIKASCPYASEGLGKQLPFKLLVLVSSNEHAPKAATVDDQFVSSLRSNFKFTTSLCCVLSFWSILSGEKFSRDDQNVLVWCLTYCLRSGLSPPTSPACLVEPVGSFLRSCVCRDTLYNRGCVDRILKYIISCVNKASVSQ